METTKELEDLRRNMRLLLEVHADKLTAMDLMDLSDAVTTVRTNHVLENAPPEHDAGWDLETWSLIPDAQVAGDENERLRQGFGVLIAVAMTYLTPEEVGNVIRKQYGRNAESART